MNDSLEQSVIDVYSRLLAAWNARDAQAFGDQFLSDGQAIGFDGSEMRSREQIVADLSKVFRGHPTATYVAKVRDIKVISSDVVLLSAIAGMKPPGQAALKPEVNAIQGVLARRSDGNLRIALFQNTPAAFHGRPELVRAMTEELTRVLDAGNIVSS